MKKHEKFIDLLIIGGGPAGFAAAETAGAEGLNTLLIEKSAIFGGQARFSSEVANYPGFRHISGKDLMHRFLTQAEGFGVKTQINTEVQKLEAEGDLFLIKLSTGDEVVCRSVLVACGLVPRKLPVEGLSNLENKGVFYGATPESAENYRGKSVVIYGGANSAGQAARNFATHGAIVTMVVREKDLAAGMSQYLIDYIDNEPNIKVEFGTQLTGVTGSETLESVTLTNGHVIPASGLFIFIGFVPETAWINTHCKCDERGFLISNEHLMSSTPGIFIAGDVRQHDVKRISAAAGMGAEAVAFILKYLSTK